jgi:hypothetical protein
MDNLISLEDHRVGVYQRRADEYLLDLVKDETGYALVDRIVNRPEVTGLTLAAVGLHLDGIDAGRLGLDEQE